MSRYTVALTHYREKYESLKESVAASNAFEKLPPNARVFIKPNIVVWTDKAVFPKWGVITTSRILEDIVVLLKDKGAREIIIGEGIVSLDPKNTKVPEHAFQTLGYRELEKRYGVKAVNVFERPFRSIPLEEGFDLKVCEDLCESDFVVNVPVMKTHAQAIVSLGMKNLKGVLNIPSRKKCHTPDPEKNLDYVISKLPTMLPPSATVIDGIYSLERGPAPDGKARRTDLIVVSSDVLSADMVGAKVLGYEPAGIPYLQHALKYAGRPADLSDITVAGEKIEEVASFHEFDFPYNEDNSLHLGLVKKGVKGLSYRKYDNTMCTYCSIINGAVLTAIVFAWKGEPWDDVEVLTGKKMQPTPGMKKTILLGQCMCNLHKNNPAIKEAIPVRGCPPDPDEAAAAFHKAGIMIEPMILKSVEPGLGLFMKKYEGKPEFDDSFYRIE